MEERKRFAVIGGDARQAAAGRALARAGYEVCGAEEVARADYILLPLPLEQADLPLAQLLGTAKPGALALGGKVTESALSCMRSLSPAASIRTVPVRKRGCARDDRCRPGRGGWSIRGRRRAAVGRATRSGV